MATTNNDLIIPSFHFHQTTFGQNIRLENNASKAVRYTSFDHGITFTDKPVNINERIHLKIVEVDETRQWCGSLAIGKQNHINIKKNKLFLEFFCLRIYSS